MLERAIVGWLRAVAPPDWADDVIGDLQEDLARGRRGARLRTLIHLARIAARFTVEAAGTHWRDRSRGGEMSTLVHDVRHAIRSLRQSPRFSIIAVLTLALAIGANTAIYTTLSALILNPLPFAEGHRYVFIWHKNPDMAGLLLTPSTTAVDRWRGATHIFDAVESYTSRSVVVTEGGEPDELSLTFLQPSTFRTFGVRSIIGRALVEADLAPDAPPVVILGHAFWLSRFGGASDVVGRPLTLGDRRYTVIGVMPRRFELPMGSESLWAPARADLMAVVSDSRNTVARLATGVSVAQAQAALSGMIVPEGPDKGWMGQVMSPADSNGASVRTALNVLSGAVGVLLLIACVNVANLMLSRHSGRQREVAIRHALGASRRRIVRYLLIESMLVAAAGGVVGVAIARLAVTVITGLAPNNLEALTRVELDAGSWMFAAAASAVTAVLFGVMPAVAGSRVHLQDVLKAGGRSATPGGQRVRAVLTVAQVAMALVLLVGAGLLGRSYAKLIAVDPGYEPAGIISVPVSLPASRYPAKEPVRRAEFFAGVLEGVASIPGVRNVAIGNGVPPASGVSFGRLEVEGVIEGAQAKSAVLSGGYVTASYFSTLGIPVLEGRVFTSDDTFGRDRVVVVGQSFAREYWPGRSPIGARLRLQPDSPWSTVIGVVGDVRAVGLAGGPGPGRLQLYQSRLQVRPGFGAIVVRADGDPAPIISAVKARIWAADPQLVLRDVATAQQLMSRSASQSRFNVALLLSLAVSGLVLALVGVYGVTALFVGQRQREMGIRMALGATRLEVMRFVARRSMAFVGVGLVIGAVGAAWLSRFLRDLVFEIGTADALSYAVPVTAIAMAAALATAIPVRRASTVDPAVVLRGE